VIQIDKQVAYWREGAGEDWEVARDLVDRGRARHGLFFAHLALEKALKAHVCQKTKDLAPRIHNLVRLAEVAELSLTPAQVDVLAEMNAFSLEGRYPETLSAPLTALDAHAYMARAGEVFTWLMKRW
jgi:HEPN domain-containing protein